LAVFSIKLIIITYEAVILPVVCLSPYGMRLFQARVLRRKCEHRRDEVNREMEKIIVDGEKSHVLYISLII
jgi:hypothetical protein